MIPFAIPLRNTYSSVWVRFGALTRPQKIQDCHLYITSMLTALFATYKEIVMKTFYFVSFDNGFMEFAHVVTDSMNKAYAYLAQTSCPKDQFWASVSEDEYVNLRNQEVED